jgi:hypothetical protein
MNNYATTTNLTTHSSAGQLSNSSARSNHGMTTFPLNSTRRHYKDMGLLGTIDEKNEENINQSFVINHMQ